MAGKNKLIVIVDDEESNRYLIKNILEKKGYTNIKSYENGKRLIEDYKQNPDMPVGLVITDGNMEEMNGRETIKELKNKGYDGKIIGISGHLGTLDGLSEAGADITLEKPFGIEELVEKVEELYN